MIKPQNKRNDNLSRCIGRAQGQLEILRTMVQEIQCNLRRADSSDELDEALEGLWAAYLEAEKALEKELAYNG